MKFDVLHFRRNQFEKTGTNKTINLLLYQQKHQKTMFTFIIISYHNIISIISQTIRIINLFLISSVNRIEMNSEEITKLYVCYVIPDKYKVK